MERFLSSRKMVKYQLDCLAKRLPWKLETAKSSGRQNPRLLHIIEALIFMARLMLSKARCLSATRLTSKMSQWFTQVPPRASALPGPWQAQLNTLM
jgi:hypothetical protein